MTLNEPTGYRGSKPLPIGTQLVNLLMASTVKDRRTEPSEDLMSPKADATITSEKEYNKFIAGLEARKVIDWVKHDESEYV